MLGCGACVLARAWDTTNYTNDTWYILWCAWILWKYVSGYIFDQAHNPIAWPREPGNSCSTRCLVAYGDNHVTFGIYSVDSQKYVIIITNPIYIYNIIVLVWLKLSNNLHNQLHLSIGFVVLIQFIHGKSGPYMKQIGPDSLCM